MDKETLVTFIEKYNLSGTVESVKLTSDGDCLKTSFVSTDKSLAGSVTIKGLKLDKGEYCVYDTAKLKKFLSILSDDIAVTPIDVDGRVVSLTISDSAGTEISFMLSDPSVIPTAPKVKAIASFEVEIPLDDTFVSQFVKAKNALPDVDNFTLLMNKKSNKLEMVIGYSSVNSNRIKVPVNPVAGKDAVTGPISFNANYLKEVLNANKGTSGAVFKVALAGISQVTFVDGDFESTYYLIKKNIDV